MPRPLLIRSKTHPYHVTSRCNNKEFFPIPLDEVWEIMMKQLSLEVQKGSVYLFDIIFEKSLFPEV